jgi:hypothetical protein
MVDTPSHVNASNQSSKTLASHNTSSANLSFPLKLLNRAIDQVNDVLISDMSSVHVGSSALSAESTGSILDQLVVLASSTDGPGAAASDVASDALAVGDEGRAARGVVLKGRVAAVVD